MSAVQPGLTWISQIPCAVTDADVAALEARFQVTLPVALRTLFLEHSGQQVQPSLFYAQSTQTGKWRKESIGFIYPAAAAAQKKSQAENAPGDEERESDRDAAGLSSYSAAVVNEMFEDIMAEKDEHNLAAAASSAASASPAIHFFAFAESPNSGHLIVLDTRTSNVMLLDVTQRRGPWVVATSVEAFLDNLRSGDAIPPEGEVEEEKADDDAADDGMVDGQFDGDDGEEDAYCCDACGDMIDVDEASVRFHCQQCENYDLCSGCHAQAQSASSSSSSKDAHPKDHKFTPIQGENARAEADEEEEEKADAKPAK